MTEAFPIELEGVTCMHGSHVALDDCSLQIRSNTITSIIGRSGSGKTTLLRSVNRMVTPISGQIRIFGEEAADSNPVSLRRKLGYSVQGSGLFPHLTIKQNIEILAIVENWDLSRRHERTGRLLQLVDLSPTFLNKFPHELSGGEQQRVALCRAMMLDPPILLLDEAFGALDPLTKRGIHQQILQMQTAEPHTIMLVTHDMREALRLSDRIVVLDEGRVEQYGTRDEISTNPASAIVRDLLEEAA